MTQSITGGCACGQVRYELADQPIFHIRCHCDDCRKASGSAFADVLMVASDRLTVSGAEPKTYTVTADSGRSMSRAFCGACGSPVLIRRPDNSLVAFLQAGSLDDPNLFAPQVVVFACHAQPSTPAPVGVPVFDKGPPADLVRPVVEAHFANRR